MKDTKKPAGKSTPAKPVADKELDDFAHHMAEVLRIARTSGAITSRFYNDLAEAWNNFINEMPR